MSSGVREPGSFSEELLLFCTFRAAYTTSSRVCAPGKCRRNSWFSIFSALRTPCLRECAHRARYLENWWFSLLFVLLSSCLRVPAHLVCTWRAYGDAIHVPVTTVGMVSLCGPPLSLYRGLPSARPPATALAAFPTEIILLCYWGSFGFPVAFASW